MLQKHVHRVVEPVENQEEFLVLKHVQFVVDQVVYW
jgi:hypothetical protein